MVDKIYYHHGSGNHLALGPDVLVSPKRFYFGRLQQDGKFVVYRGTPEDQRDLLWSSGSSAPPAGSRSVLLGFGHPPYEADPLYLRVVAEGGDGRFHDLWTSSSFKSGADNSVEAVLEDDGNVCVYKLIDGHRPPSNARLWQSATTDPVVDYDIAKLVYDLDAAEIVESIDFSIYSGSVENRTDRDRTFHFGRTDSTAIMSGWSDSLAIKVGIKTTFDAGIPLIGESKVELSLETTNTYTWNGSTTETRSFTWSADIIAGPGEIGRATVSGKTSTIRVPYSLTGDVIFKSGRRLSRQIDGIYEGRNSHSVKCVYTQDKMPPKVIPITVTFD